MGRGEMCACVCEVNGVGLNEVGGNLGIRVNGLGWRG